MVGKEPPPCAFFPFHQKACREVGDKSPAAVSYPPHSPFMPPCRRTVFHPPHASHSYGRFGSRWETAVPQLQGCPNSGSLATKGDSQEKGSGRLSPNPVPTAQLGGRGRDCKVCRAGSLGPGKLSAAFLPCFSSFKSSLLTSCSVLISRDWDWDGQGSVVWCPWLENSSARA